MKTLIEIKEALAAARARHVAAREEWFLPLDGKESVLAWDEFLATRKEVLELNKELNLYNNNKELV
jgi:hypothetical protein